MGLSRCAGCGVAAEGTLRKCPHDRGSAPDLAGSLRFVSWHSGGVGADRAGARQWGSVLSELSEVPVDVGYERPYWVGSWVDGPTMAMLETRTSLLDPYGVGAPLRPDQLRFRRRFSSLAWALAWLDHGMPRGGNPLAAMSAVEERLEATAYPRRRPRTALAAADVLACLAGGDEYRMGVMLTAARPNPAPPPEGEPPVDLPGRVRGRVTARVGLPLELLGITAPAAPASADLVTDGPACQPPGAPSPAARSCQTCGRPMQIRTTGRPGRYCSATCRSRAWRQRHSAPA